MDGFTNQYQCAPDIYLLSCIALEFYIIIYREVGEPGHRKYFVDGLNDRYKLMLRLEMAALLNPESI